MPETNHLKRGLTNRHVQLIALGGAVGTGLFLGTDEAIRVAGPGILLSYIFGGGIAFLIMRQLGEMMTEEPVAGSFSNLAYTYWGDFPGLLSGWNYWILYVLVGMAELTAVSRYVNYWFPHVPEWQTIFIFFLLINAINLAAVKIYGEMEFWFAIIKVAAIIGMIFLGGYLLVSGQGGPDSTIRNLWIHEGFLPHGVAGVVLSLAVVMFSFGGLELVGIAAAETDDPTKTIPRAVNQVLYRILIFYVGALVVLLALYPWNLLGAAPSAGVDWSQSMSASPFVKIFNKIGIPAAAHVLNLVVLTAALSVYNSCVYCNSRMLYGLALQGNAPRALGRVDRRGVPVLSIALSSAATLACVALNYLMPGEALGVLMALVVAALVINWSMITLTHLKFRPALNRQGIRPRFPAFWFPVANYICLVFMGLVLLMLCLTGKWQSVALLPVWVLLVWIGHRIKLAK